MTSIAVIGAGPAGLMAAERLSAAGHAVTLYDHKPAPGRKLLMAGRGGLNLTHSEPLPQFLGRYGEAEERLAPVIHAFPPEALREWAEGLGQPSFTGSSGRVFPKTMKASPLLRAWLGRLETQGVKVMPRHRWLGWTEDGALSFAGLPPAGADAVLLALGGAAWPRLGSDGGWAKTLAERGVALAPFRPANCGFTLQWSQHFRERYAGQPIKSIALRFHGQQARGDAIIASYGIEGGPVYALAAALRDAIAAEGHAILQLDLRPDLPAGEVAKRLAALRPRDSLSTGLRRTLALAPAAIGLLREVEIALPRGPAALAARIKAIPLRLTAAQSLDRAISSAGGVIWDEVDDSFMLRRLPGVFVAGEMLDWEAPTGGYLLQACMATGVAAATGLLDWLERR
ncbi:MULTISPECIES: TIGR03862 family flavoprotein [unclassified Acidisoma]|uniref:TIGR03862 family flavoprotein n=1 Tax=unclassified Acidisoma TaxID=2634065 RepID=UPI00131A8187|nr:MULTISPECIES: TIGR03862 family flavoprotein [unclassified Acidisoma]